MFDKQRLSLIAIFLVMISLVACNVFDPLYSDEAAGDLDKALSNADAAMRRDEYGLAASLYLDALALKPSSSKAMLGLSSAIILRDVQIKDVPALMNAIFNIDTSAIGTNSTFLPALSDSPEAYRKKIMAAVSNASWYRAPIFGIDPGSGKITLGPDSLPYVSSTESDGVISPHDRNALLNYIMIKAIHVALIVQEEFLLSAGLFANLDIGSLKGYNTGDIWTNNDASHAQTFFTNFYNNLTNTREKLGKTYEGVTNLLMKSESNGSLLNLLDVAEGLVNILAAPDSGLADDIVELADNAIKDIKASLGNLEESLTEEGTGIKQGFDELDGFIAQLKDFGENDTIPGIKPGSWFD